MWIDTSAWVVRRLEIDSGSETLTIYEFPDPWHETSLADSLFRFDPPPGVETFDLP
jgi:outer membrane lipoprotein-sorting protein